MRVMGDLLDAEEAPPLDSADIIGQAVVRRAWQLDKEPGTGGFQLSISD